MELTRSTQITASLVAAVASSLSTVACQNRTQDCVDSAGRVVNDSYCRSGSRGMRWIPHVSSGGFGGYGGGSGFFGG